MTAPAWVDELDLRAGPPEAAMGTRALDPTRWLLVDDGWTAQRVEARRLLRTRSHDVLRRGAPQNITRTAIDAAAEAVGARIDRWLAVHAPDVMDGGHRHEHDPLAAARARVAEDLCLLVPDDAGVWWLSAGVVCFPSYWRLADKIGQPLDAVHGPVPGYHGSLAARVDTFLGRLQPGQGVWRRNWSIHGVPDLFLPVHGDPSIGPVRWLRSEYQTLLRLEHHGDDDNRFVVFTIRTQQVPLTELGSRPDVCAAMAAALRAWTPAQRAYKGSAVDEGVVAWLKSPRG